MIIGRLTTCSNAADSATLWKLPELVLAPMAMSLDPLCNMQRPDVPTQAILGACVQKDHGLVLFVNTPGIVAPVVVGLGTNGVVELTK